MRYAVKLFRDCSNPQGLPGEWPSELKVIKPGHVSIQAPWIAMTPEEYDAYLAEHEPKYKAWIAAGEEKARKKSLHQKVAKVGGALAGAGGAAAALLQYLV